jgi:hypothetical protein
LKRLDDKALQELYPATTTEFADPVEGDDPTVAAFRPLLAKTQLETLPLRCGAPQGTAWGTTGYC